MKRRRPVPVTIAGLAVGVSILPDIVHLLPVTIWAIFGLGTIDQLFAYATAVPGSEPAMPSWVGLPLLKLSTIIRLVDTTARDRSLQIVTIIMLQRSIYRAK